MIIALQLLVAIIGLFMFFFCSNPKWVKVGEYMLFCGTLSFLMTFRGVPAFHITG